jgi:S-adenosylmethionine:tRNA ribosyltransferase-isomerase
MKVSDFDFDLPHELIAQEAVARGRSRLLVLDRASGSYADASIADLPQFLRAGDALVLNDTRVFPARLLGRREPGGGAVECLLIGRIDEGNPAQWDALVHPGQKLREGSRMVFGAPPRSLQAEVLQRRFHGRRTIRLWSEGDATVDELVDTLGHVPLPPYIKRADRPEDRDRYQTIYASKRGSVAAPTAGLHFSAALLDDVVRRGVERVDTTLHVGYGTFKPVRTDVVEEHEVDPEMYDIPARAADALNRAIRDRRRIVAVGTTTTRALEAATIVPEHTEGSSDETAVTAGPGLATLFIHPGYRFKVVNALLTNFHLPRSSLFMLVAAFAGREQLLAAYRHAIEQRYRFYSYGDAMLIV